MKKKSWGHILFVIIADAVLINAALIIGYYFKYGLPGINGMYPHVLILKFSRNMLFATVASLAILNTFGIYSRKENKAEIDEAGAIIGGLTVSMVLFEAMTFLYREIIFSRMVIFVGWIAAMVLLVAFHIAVIAMRKQMYSSGIGTEKVAVVGTNDIGLTIARRIKEHPEMGLRMSGFIHIDGEEHGEKFHDFKILGDVADLKKIVRHEKLSKVILAKPDTPADQMMSLIEKCELEKAQFQFIPRMLDIIESRISSDEITGIPLITVREIKLYGLNAFLKRAFDVTAGTAILLLISPVMLAVAALIKLESPRGGVLFMQKRVGRDGERFVIFKFRSMVEGAEKYQESLEEKNEAQGHIFKIKKDPRVTRIGRFIRKWSIDELPQIFNVIKGDMSLVGPRPPLPKEVQKYNEWHKKRLRVQPGITGLWQVSGRSELAFDDMVKLDLIYIETWSLWLDIKIILKTVPVVLFAKGAY